MIKTTINGILNVTPVLRELAVKPFKGAMTFKIARLIRELDKETALFEESRSKLADKYGVKNVKGCYYKQKATIPSQNIKTE